MLRAISVVSEEESAAIKARSANLSYAYSDHEIDAVNKAKNICEGIGYLAIDGVSTGILSRGFDVNLTSDNLHERLYRSPYGEIIIELPACAVDQGSPIEPRLIEQLEHFKKLQIAIGEANSLPLKILFPYKLRAWHWNAGQITINKNSEGKFIIQGLAVDSYGVGKLEDEIQEVIALTLLTSGFGDLQSIEMGAVTNVAKVQTGVACGLYAAIAIHNLKRNPDLVMGSKAVWSGAGGVFIDDESRKTEIALREEFYDLVRLHHPNPTVIRDFCKERQLLDRASLMHLEHSSGQVSGANAADFYRKNLSLLDEVTKRSLALALEDACDCSKDPKAILDRLEANLMATNYELLLLFFEYDEKGLRGSLCIDFSCLPYLSDLLDPEVFKVKIAEILEKHNIGFKSFDLGDSLGIEASSFVVDKKLADSLIRPFPISNPGSGSIMLMEMIDNISDGKEWCFYSGVDNGFKFINNQGRGFIDQSYFPMAMIFPYKYREEKPSLMCIIIRSENNKYDVNMFDPLTTIELPAPICDLINKDLMVILLAATPSASNDDESTKSVPTAINSRSHKEFLLSNQIKIPDAVLEAVLNLEKLIKEKESLTRSATKVVESIPENEEDVEVDVDGMSEVSSLTRSTPLSSSTDTENLDIESFKKNKRIRAESSPPNLDGAIGVNEDEYNPIEHYLTLEHSSANLTPPFVEVVTDVVSTSVATSPSADAENPDAESLKQNKRQRT